ncbi:hypothetical protein RB595_006826 [Gaeumannomyces hyphopodioides]
MTVTVSARKEFHTTVRGRSSEAGSSRRPENEPNSPRAPEYVKIGRKQFADFNLAGKVIVVTGGARGLGLSMAEGLAEAGGNVYCLDRAPQPEGDEWAEAQRRVVPEWGGSLSYRRQDVTDVAGTEALFAAIADENGGRLDGAVAAAGVQHLSPALDYGEADAARMLAINYTGVLTTAKAAARQMMRRPPGEGGGGSICFVASMSGLLARNLAMEWTRAAGVRVNCISPGHILTPMVRKNFREVPGLRETWEAENMMGRLAEPEEFKGAVLFLMSGASSFVTGSNMVIDGGHTAW